MILDSYQKVNVHSASSWKQKIKLNKSIPTFANTHGFTPEILL